MAERGLERGRRRTFMAEQENSRELNEDCSFVWDEASQLYFHARTGFYHDPNAGWYYSTKDGLYYKFEDGNYVPLNHDAVDERDGGGTHEIFMRDESHSHKGFDGGGISSLNGGVEVEGCHQEQTVVNEAPPASAKREVDSMAGRSADLQEECSFIWDETLQLYFDARSGFYHDPNAGWYYSSTDGIYYKFQNGHYVPLKSDLVDKGDVGGTCVNSLQNESQSHTCHGRNNNHSSILRHESEACQHEETIADEASSDNEAAAAVHHASEDAQPPSEWLEDTLIELYLAGYSNETIDAGGESGDAMTPPEACDQNDFRLSSPGTNDAYELEEGEWIPEDLPVPSVSNEDALNQVLLQDEEKWQAQYGQVIQSREEPALEFPVVDLWDWEVVRGSGKDGKSQVVRLVGRLVKRSAKLHPSMPAGGGFLKTAPICQVRFDLVRVRTGKIYKLRSPTASYLATVTSYDSSNPTKDWGFPELVAGGESVSLSKATKYSESKKATDVEPDELLASQKQIGPGYKDRAAARRMLHHGYGVGPGQKNLPSRSDDVGSSGTSVSTEEAAAEALNMSFGAGSFARKVLESMGWKEGEGLGRTVKGSVEPVRAVGNVGSAGLGWPHSRTKCQ